MLQPSLVMFDSSLSIHLFMYEPTPQVIWTGKFQPLETAYDTVQSEKTAWKLYVAHSQFGKNSSLCICMSSSYDKYILYLCDMCIYEYVYIHINTFISF